MIELFDAKRLLPRHDRSLVLAGVALALGLTGLALHGAWLSREIDRTLAAGKAAQAEVARLKGQAPPPAPALLAELAQQAQQLEAELAAAGAASDTAGQPMPSASQWLERLDSLSRNDIGLTVVDIDRVGVVRLEGLARTPPALSAYVQAWDQQQANSPLRPRGLEVRQDDKAAPFLRFQLRANLGGGKP